MAISAQIYEDQVHACRQNIGLNSNECEVEAEKHYRASAGRIYRDSWSDTLMDCCIYAISGIFLSVLMALAVRIIGFLSATFARSSGPLIQEPKRIILSYEAPVTVRPFNNFSL
jgi:hypothetical protein